MLVWDIANSIIAIYRTQIMEWIISQNMEVLMLCTLTIKLFVFHQKIMDCKLGTYKMIKYYRVNNVKANLKVV